MAMDGGFDGTGPAPGGCDQPGQAAGGSRSHALPDPSKLAQDWITLWQSELSAMAADPETRESWQTVMGLWAGSMAEIIRGLSRGSSHGGSSHGGSGHDEAGHDGQARPNDAPRSAPAAAAPRSRDAEVERLALHVATLERRLAKLERGGDHAVAAKRGAGRKPGK